MSNFISLRIDRENEACRLSLEFRSGEYAGRGSAYFDSVMLVRKAEEFSMYPLPADRSVVLEGGFLDKSDFTKLSQEHLHISVYPLGYTGRIGLLVRVAEPSEDERRDVFRRSAAAEFMIDYERLSWFSKGLMELVAGRQDEFTFKDVE